MWFCCATPSMKLVTEGEASPQTLRQYGLGAQILSALGLSADHAGDQFESAQGGRAGGLWADDRRHAPDFGGLGHGGFMKAITPCRCPHVRQAGEAADRGGTLLQGHRRSSGGGGAGHGGGLWCRGRSGRGAGRAGGADRDCAGRTSWRITMVMWRLGCVIRGETTHYDTVCNDSSRGAVAVGVARCLHRQRHPDGGKPRAGRSARRSCRAEQGRRRRRRRRCI